MALANASLLENALMSGKRILAADGENRVSTLTTHLGNSMSARVGNLRRLVNGNIGQLQGNTSELEAPLQMGMKETPSWVNYQLSIYQPVQEERGLYWDKWLAKE